MYRSTSRILSSIALALTAESAIAQESSETNLERVTRETITVIEERILERDTGPARPEQDLTGQTTQRNTVNRTPNRTDTANDDSNNVDLEASAIATNHTPIASLPAAIPVEARTHEIETRVAVVTTLGECGGRYTIGSGDTLTGIALKLYGDAENWSLIYYANQQTLNKGPSIIYVGRKLSIPCRHTDAQPATEIVENTVRTQANTEIVTPTTEAESTIATNNINSRPNLRPAARNRRANRPLKLLTASDYYPFTQRDAENGGMFTELVMTALEEANVDYKLTWINDWSAHLDPLLSEYSYDMGFPWYRPDCHNTPENMRCKNFFFSDPVFEVLVMLYSRADNPIEYVRNEDIEGLTLCRPSGYFTFDLDQDGRNWISERKITLRQPSTPKDCFEMLLAGEVDGVTLNELTARETLHNMAIRNQIYTSERALSLPTLHLLIHKAHPMARTMLYRFNQALAELQDNGHYTEIVARHLTTFWDQFEE